MVKNTYLGKMFGGETPPEIIGAETRGDGNE